jgi:transcriptional regulator with XRE-family HTH domain
MWLAGRMETIYVELGKRIEKRRSKKKWRQEDLAELVGVTRTQIVMIENGQRRLMLHDVAKYARALKISPATLLRGIWE